MIRQLIASLIFGAALCSQAEIIRIGDYEVSLPASYRHVASNQPDLIRGVFQHRKDGSEISYDIGGWAGKNRPKDMRNRWGQNVIRDGKLKTGLGTGRLIIVSGDGTDKVAYFEADGRLGFLANLGTGTHLDDFLEIVQSVKRSPAASPVNKNAEQDAPRNRSTAVPE